MGNINANSSAPPVVERRFFTQPNGGGQNMPASPSGVLHPQPQQPQPQQPTQQLGHRQPQPQHVHQQHAAPMQYQHQQQPQQQQHFHAPHPYQFPHPYAVSPFAPVPIHGRLPAVLAPPPPPPPPAAVTQTTVRVRNDVSLRKDSLRLEATAAPNRFALRFAVDARQCDCSVQVYFCASETTDSQNNAVVIDEHVVPRPQGPREVVVRQGENRPIVFDAPADLLDLGGLTDLQLSFIGGVSYAPLVIVISRIASRETDDEKHDGPVQVVDRLISYVGCGPVSGPGGTRALSVAKQKAQVGAQSFVLEEIYGLSTNSQTGECVVCLCEPPSTTIFPCRHLVVCADCAATLRLQGHASRCPVCRCRIESLLNLTASA